VGDGRADTRRTKSGAAESRARYERERKELDARLKKQREELDDLMRRTFGDEARTPIAFRCLSEP